MAMPALPAYCWLFFGINLIMETNLLEEPQGIYGDKW